MESIGSCSTISYWSTEDDCWSDELSFILPLSEWVSKENLAQSFILRITKEFEYLLYAYF